MNGPQLFISAGDLSGDNAMARVLTELAGANPGLRTFGLGGEKLKGLGQEQFASGKEIAVIGFWEVAKRYRFFVKLMGFLYLYVWLRATLPRLRYDQLMDFGWKILIPVTRVPVISWVPRRPDQPVDGQIVSIYSGLAETGTQSVVTLNRGARHGMQLGYVLELLDSGATIVDRTISPSETIQLPDQRIGNLFVFRIFDDISYALVLRVTRPVRIGDRFVDPE